MFPTWRKPTVIAVSLLVVAVAAVASFFNVQLAAWLLSSGLVAAAGIRMVAPEHHILAARGRRFDVVVLLVLAVALAILAPWGLSESAG